MSHEGSGHETVLSLIPYLKNVVILSFSSTTCLGSSATSGAPTCRVNTGPPGTCTRTLSCSCSFFVVALYLTAMQKLRIVSLGGSGGRSLTRTLSCSCSRRVVALYLTATGESVRSVTCEGVRVGDRSRGRYATPADSPRHDGTPYRGLHVRCERFVSFKGHFLSPRPKP
jgi:hypothetical protein